MRQLPDEWVKVNLGCNRNSFKGWLNVDASSFEGVDLVIDLEKIWPWPDSSIHYIRAFDIVEHLRDPIHTMNEAWRVLSNGGLVEIWVPSTDGRGAFQDPTHVSFWNSNSFLYYTHKQYAGTYPDRIKCNFDIRLFDTPANSLGIVWTWALCRVIKPEEQVPLALEQWFNALSSRHAKDRVVSGYDGTFFGTTQIDEDLDLINL